MRKHIITLTIALLGLTFVSFMASDSIVLRFKPQVGKTLTCQVKSTQVMSISMQGQSMNTTQIVESKSEMTATKVTADSVFCETQMKTMKLTSSAMGMTMVYDSEHPEKTSPLLAASVKDFQDAIDKKIAFSCDVKGNTKATGSGTPSFSAIYPEEAVSVGSHWTSDYTQDISGTEMNVTMTYTVTKITKKETTISLEGVIESSVASGTNSGTMVVDNATGITKTSTIKTDLEMTISEQGISIPTTVSGTTTITIE